MIKFAIICSAGGSSFFTAYDILIDCGLYASENFLVITDRECDAEKEATTRKISWKRIDFDNRDCFSKKVKQTLLDHEVNYVLMLYSRLVTKDIYYSFPTFNIHPSLLPAFKGINAPDSAMKAGVKFIGATLHLTNDEMDSGQIVIQTVRPLIKGLSNDDVQTLSYLQKTYLVLTFLDCIYNDLVLISEDYQNATISDLAKYNYLANPCIQTQTMEDKFIHYQETLAKRKTTS